MPQYGKPYLESNGAEWNPPGGQWQTTKANSTHGRILVGYYKDGLVTDIDKPLDIWQRFPVLRVVCPYNRGCNWRTFCRNCKRAAEDDDNDVEEEDMSDPSDDDYASDESTPPRSRMSMPREPPRTANGTPTRPDAKGRRRGPAGWIGKILKPFQDYFSKNQVFASPTRIHPMESGYLFQYPMFAPLPNVSSYDFYTLGEDVDHHDVVCIEIEDCFGDEEDCLQLMCTGQSVIS